MEKEGFFENEIARRTDLYGNIAHVFSTYASYHKADDKKPFARGINSFQLLNDGKRWWVLTIYWQGETPETLISKEYLKSKKAKVMAGHILTRKLTLNLPIEKIFDFFADAGNLERITPPELNFKIITPQPIDIKKGTLIDYQLKLRGLPLTWKTIITTWNPPHVFVDEALKSPYKQWIHRHNFTKLSANQTLIEDEMKYRLPLEPFGDLAHWYVRRELDYIFNYRQKAVKEILQPGEKQGKSAA